MRNHVNKSVWIILPSVFLFLFSHAFAQQEHIRASDGLFYKYRGLAKYHKGQYDQAISDFDKTLEIYPRHDDVYS
jgi:tetratricopeptide (TPR) repeat protein